MKRLLSVLLCLMAVACGSGEDRPGAPSNVKAAPRTGTGGTGSTEPDAGADSDSGPTGLPGAPVVTVTSPSAASSPNDPGVLLDDSVTVLCSVQPSSTADAGAVDPGSVQMELLDSTGAVIGDPVPGTPVDDGTYSAQFILTNVPGGKISFRCIASTSGDPALTGSDTLSTYLDQGPTIVANSPAEGSSYPLQALSFDFSVLPGPLASGDTGAAVTAVTLTINDVPFALAPTGDGTYSVPVDLTDTATFANQPDGPTTVSIHAVDARGAEADFAYSFVVDSTGPLITITSHSDQQVVGGRVTLQFTVVDTQSGVNPDSVFITIGTDPGRYFNDGEWTHPDDQFTYTFDSRTFADTTVQIPVTIVAKDNAGNLTTGESLILYIDNQPPIVDLDPGNVRDLRDTGTSVACSGSFDPLGNAIDDLAPTPDFTRFRALVWDETNGGEGQAVQYLAGADEASVYLYLQPDTSVPLLINNDSDLYCDELAYVGLTFDHLNVIAEQGSADYTKDDPTEVPLPGDCPLATQTTPPLKLCQDHMSDLTRVIRHNDAAADPVIYGTGDLQGLECTGGQRQLSSWGMQEGWICVAARAQDLVGNVGISPPLRICYSDGVDPPPNCDPSTAPTCTDGCLPPPGFAPRIIKD